LYFSCHFCYLFERKINGSLKFKIFINSGVMRENMEKEG